jgi:hypothetical protein
VPPTETTYGELVGQFAVGNGYTPDSRCCLLKFAVPKSPEETKKLSFFASPFWNTLSNLAVCVAAAPPNVCSVTPNDIENSVPDGVASISPEIALKRFGKPCTPSVSAGGTASRMM